VTKALTIDGGVMPTGTLDLTNNKMILDYSAPSGSPLPTIQAQITSGYASGSWNGNGIRSTGAASGCTGHSTALGYAEAPAAGSAIGAIVPEPVSLGAAASFCAMTMCKPRRRR